MSKKKNYRVTGKGICFRCKQPTQERQHISITEKHLKQPFYYSKWYYCYNKECRTTTIMEEEDRIYNDNKQAKYFKDVEEEERQQSFLKDI